MKKTFILMLLLIGAWIPAAAQKFALVDMEYILRNVPSYEMAKRTAEPGEPAVGERGQRAFERGRDHV